MRGNRAGDWNKDGFDSVGVYRINAVYLTNTESGAGSLDVAYNYGTIGDIAVAGKWINFCAGADPNGPPPPPSVCQAPTKWYVSQHPDILNNGGLNYRFDLNAAPSGKLPVCEEVTFYGTAAEITNTTDNNNLYSWYLVDAPSVASGQVWVVQNIRSSTGSLLKEFLVNTRPAGCGVPTATPTPTITFTPTMTLTPSITPTGPTPTPNPVQWPAPDILASPNALLPRFTSNPPASQCVAGSSDGASRRACAIRAYNAVWDYLSSIGQPMTWNRFFAITLQGEAGVLYDSNLTHLRCGRSNGNELVGDSACQGLINLELIGALERALIRQIVQVCKQDGSLTCTEDEMITFLGGQNVPASQQQFGIEAWYNAGRTSSTDATPNISKLLGINLNTWDSKVDKLVGWTGASSIQENKLKEGCDSGFACSWGNCTNFNLNRTGLFWTIYQGQGDYSVNGQIQFIVGQPILVNGQPQVCR